jgi:hypothetical protein
VADPEALLLLLLLPSSALPANPAALAELLLLTPLSTAMLATSAAVTTA